MARTEKSRPRDQEPDGRGAGPDHDRGQAAPRPLGRRPD